MGRTLRVGLAMGGGVSMGTFSGVALGETLKLLTLFGGYRDNGAPVPYEDVVVDVFSGASAGALSLMLMLRALSKQDRALADEMKSEDNLRAWLEGLGQPPMADTDPRWDKLLVAQYVQDLEQRLWVDEVNIKKLCTDPDGGMAATGSLLNRGVQEDICARYFGFKNDFDFSGKRFLGDRVLFACSLSNLSPLTQNAKRDENGNILWRAGALTDGMTSPVHKDMRVFDLRFRKPGDGIIDDERISPRRWWRYYADVAKDEDRYGSLSTKGAWARMAATSIACGCFPFAFEPVVLLRKAFEYPPNVWKGLFSGFNGSLATGTPPLDGGEFPFTYIDGGVFNNEPIREAFRLASFLDSVRPEDTASDGSAEYDRVIVFIDPTTGSGEVSYSLSFHSDISLHDPKWYAIGSPHKARKRMGLSKILSLVPSVLQTITDEGCVVEADGIDATRTKFVRRREIRERVLALPFDGMDQGELASTALAVWNFCAGRLEEEFQNTLIPTGTLTVRSELARMLDEHGDALDSQVAADLRTCLDNLPPDDNGTLDALPGCFSQPPLTASLAKLLYCVAIDLLMELEGKPEGQGLIAIAPWDIETAGGQTIQRKIDLPADELAAFAGFISRKANVATIPAAELCTRKHMLLSGYLAMGEGTELDSELHRKYEPDFKISEVREEIEEQGQWLVERVRKIIKDSYLFEDAGLFEGIGKSVAAGLAGKSVEKLLRDIPPSRTLPVRIYVKEGSKLHLDRENHLGGRFDDLDPIPDPLNNGYYLPMELSYRPRKYDMANDEWSGNFLTKKDDGIQLSTQKWHGSSPVEPIPLPTGAVIAQTLFYPGYYLKYDLTDDEDQRDRQHWKVAASGYAPLEDDLESRF